MAQTTRSVEVMHDWQDGDGRAAIEALFEVFRGRGGSVTERPADSVRLSAKTGLLRADPPDVWFDWPGMNLEPYVEADVLADLTPIWEANGLADSYLEGAQSVARFDDRYVAVPTNIHGLNNLFYDVETVEAAGVDPAGVDSPREFLAVLEQVVAETGAVGFVQPWKNPAPLLQLWAATVLGEFGLDTYRAIIDGDARENRGSIAEALDIVREFAEFVTDDALFLDMAAAPHRFTSTDAAFFFQGDWAASVLNAATDFEYRTDWEHVPFPGTDGQFLMNMDAALVAGMTDARDGIDEFLRTVSSVDGQRAFNSAKGSIPPRTDVPEDDFSPFGRTQMRAFERSRAQPPSIAHGLAVRPNQHIQLLTAFASFAADWDVDAATGEILATLGD